MINHEPSTVICLCPKLAAPNKPGRKTSGKRTKGPLEGNKKKRTKKKRIGQLMEMEDAMSILDEWESTPKTDADLSSGNPVSSV